MLVEHTSFPNLHEKESPITDRMVASRSFRKLTNRVHQKTVYNGGWHRSTDLARTGVINHKNIGCPKRGEEKGGHQSSSNL